VLKTIVTNFLKKYDLEDKTIVVGFSGGYDSMCLLDILSKIKNEPEYDDLKIVAAHFNHNWRGAESLREQEVCRLFAASKGFEFYTKNAPADLKKDENSARLARYEFFEECMENFDADAVFTAHNKDDNAETVLYRVVKGTGLNGLKGISECRNCFYRPLLKVSRAEISEYCSQNNLMPNNDSSNSNIKYNRNYIRLNIIPALEKINPTVKEALNTLAEVAISENSIIEEYLGPKRAEVYTDEGINPVKYAELSTPIKMRFLHEYIQSLDLDYDFKRIKEIYEFIEQNITKRNGSTISLTASMWLYADNKTIEVLPNRKSLKRESEFEEIKVDSAGDYKVGNNIFSIKEYVDKNVFVFPDSTANFVYVDLSDVDFPFSIRTRKEGDIINPFGMNGSMKLKKYFNSKGVNRHTRDNIILLTKENEVLWAAGVGLSNKIGVKTKPTHVIEMKKAEKGEKK